MSAQQLQALKGFNAEDVRIAAERELAFELERAARHIDVPEEPFDSRKQRRQLLASALRLTPDMAPDICRLARETRRVLGLDRAVEVYQTAGIGGENASAVYLDDVVAIVIIGQWITTMDDGAMLAVLGHEVGHYLAHFPTTRHGKILSRSRFVFAPPHLAEMARAYRLSTELTADRFGLLVCQDLDAALRLEMISTTGLPASALTWDTRAYLEQACDLMEQTAAEGESALGSSHPEHSLRAYAAWLYTESYAYCSMTGKEPGPDARTITEVDETLSKLLGVDRLKRLRPSPGSPGRPRGRGFFGSGPQRPSDRPQPSPEPEPAGEGTAAGSDWTSPLDPEKRKQIMGKAARAFDKAAKTVKPGLSQASEKAGERVGRWLGRRPGSSKANEEPEDSFDPLADDEDELLGRFAALEQGVGSSDRPGEDAGDDLDDLKRRLADLDTGSPRRSPPPPEEDDDALLARFAELERQVKKGG